MHVNVSRIKLLINNRRSPLHRPKKTPSATASRCNHCGGAIKPSGEMETCIMCGRELNHQCSNCSHVPQHEPA